LDNLCAIIDVNRLGQSDPAPLQHDMDAYKARVESFGFHAIVVDGHDVQVTYSAALETVYCTTAVALDFAKTALTR
jgi:transketolase